MKNELATTTEVSLNLQTLSKFLESAGLATSLNNQEKETFLQIAQAYQLNPFKREIYCTKYGTQMTIIVGFEVYLKRAERTGKMDGYSVKTEGSIKDGNLKAIITIYRKDWSRPYEHEVHYEEYVQTKSDGTPNKFWKEKPITMLKKVAMSQGFRLCFSDELGGMPYTSEELPQQEQITHDVIATVVQEPTKKAITDKQLQGAITRIENGETGVIEKVLETFELSTEQHQKLITTKPNVQ
jgi:phage recombination protein Bet